MCKSRVLPGAEVEAAGCCSVNVGDINLDIKKETVETAAGSIKILPCSGARSLSCMGKSEQIDD